jgi:hypothetical protein
MGNIPFGRIGPGRLRATVKGNVWRLPPVPGISGPHQRNVGNDCASRVIGQRSDVSLAHSQRWVLRAIRASAPEPFSLSIGFKRCRCSG